MKIPSRFRQLVSMLEAAMSGVTTTANVGITPVASLQALRAPMSKRKRKQK
jgi:hypothetical protein